MSAIKSIFTGVVILVLAMLIYSLITNPYTLAQTKQFFSSLGNRLNAINFSDVDKSQGVSVKDLILNPKNYNNKTITFEAKPLPNFNWQTRSLASYTIAVEDTEGKPHYLLVSYGEFYCVDCRITGIINSKKFCTCQYYAYMGQDPSVIYTNSDGKTYLNESKAEWYNRDFMEVSECEKPPQDLSFGLHSEVDFYRCDPATINDIYYLDVINVVKIS